MTITQAQTMRRGERRRQPLAAICVHTTGTGVVQAAKETGRPTLAVALAAYAKPSAPYPHAVVGQAGEVVQVAPWDRVAWHAGVTDRQRRDYESGAWRQRVPLDALARWDARWPGKRGPLEVVPGPWNETTIGIEMIPLGSAKYVGASKVYAPETIAALRELVAHLRAALGPLPLVGHEDLEPLERWDAHGGWDPGALRENPWFDWRAVA